MWKDFFFFSKGERDGLLILACLIILMFAVNFCLPAQPPIPKEITECRTATDSLAKTINDSTSLFKREERLDSLSKNMGYNSGFRPNKVRHKGKREGERTREAKRGKPGYSHLGQGGTGYDKLSIELNSADTTELKKLRGIGSVLSKRIVKYRKMVGGFKTTEQLKSVYGLSEETFQAILPHIWVDTTVTQKNPKEGRFNGKGKREDADQH